MAIARYTEILRLFENIVTCMGKGVRYEYLEFSKGVWGYGVQGLGGVYPSPGLM